MTQPQPELTTQRGLVFHMASKSYPQFRFEWHPQARAVFVIRKGVVPEIATLIAPQIDAQELARVAVFAWCGGYDEGSAKLLGAKVIV